MTDLKQSRLLGEAYCDLHQKYEALRQLTKYIKQHHPECITKYEFNQKVNQKLKGKQNNATPKS